MKRKIVTAVAAVALSLGLSGCFFFPPITDPHYPAPPCQPIPDKAGSVNC